MTKSSRLLPRGSLLIATAIATFAGCITTESRTDMPGYRFEYPRNLPETVTAYGKDGKPYEANARAHYKSEHEAGWRECFTGYRNKTIELSDPCRELPDLDPNGLQARGRRDGYEECRRMLIENGNK